MRCDAMTDDRLDTLRRRELPEGARREIEAHLLDCPPCRERLGAIRKAVAAVETLWSPTPAVPERTDRAIREAIRTLPVAAGPRWVTLLRWSGALGLAAVVLLVVNFGNPLGWLTTPAGAPDGGTPPPNGAATTSRGDVSGDGVADVLDVGRIVSAAVKGRDGEIDPAEGDLNGDGRVDVADARILARQTALGAAVGKGEVE